MTQPNPAAFLRPLADEIPRQVRWLKPGLVPLGYITLVAGVGGLGKSTWLAGVAAETSRGDLLDGEPGGVILISYEDPPAEVLRPRVEAAGGDLTRVWTIQFDGDGLDQVTLPGDLDTLEVCIRDAEARLVVVDPVVAAIDTSLDAHKDQHVRYVLSRLGALAAETDCAVAVVGHLNKAPSSDAYLRVANSVAFWNASRSVVLVTEDEADSDQRLIAQRKSNLSRLRSVERHRIEEVVLDRTFDPHTGKPIVTSRMVFVSVADDVDSGDVLAAGQTAHKTSHAESFLTLALRDGEWHESAEIKEHAQALGMSKSTVSRAKRSLGVEDERRGQHARSYWRLPQSGQFLSGHTFSLIDDLTERKAQPPAAHDPTEPSQVSQVTDLGEGEHDATDAPTFDPVRAASFDAMYPRRSA